ncbi:hypothetical protein Sru01_53380 [Sphaerisporangium rufum]|uniref:CBS domain-containing protein n=1 Tax=Sphaerisporangium rufum TaxID=1381558 RepID=A0A919R8G2_9ACTN|nr:CBS domain-containing protein [Sphaerisporangium rufum]GII80356.1 hypothetical protein Sru01_53380 [Sphaerisporangium rufum]
MHTKVRDVMTRDVVTVNGATPFRDVAGLLMAHGVSAVPVVDGEGHVVGVVSEADLLRKEEFREQYYGEGYRPPARVRLRRLLQRQAGTGAAKARGETAAQVMTAPAITVREYSSAVNAARLMDEHGIRRLPVVDDDGTLAGIVSRHDLIKVFVREDEDIAREIRQDIVEGALWPQPPEVEVSVTGGVVTLAGRTGRQADARTMVRMTERVNGVLGVVDRLEWRVTTPAGG